MATDLSPGAYSAVALARQKDCHAADRWLQALRQRPRFALQIACKRCGLVGRAGDAQEQRGDIGVDDPLYSVAANALAVPITGFWIMPWALIACLAMPFDAQALALAPIAGLPLPVRAGGWSC